MASHAHVPMGFSFLSKNEVGGDACAPEGTRHLCSFVRLTFSPGSLFDLNRIPNEEEKNAA
jgi:hypothetical protein